MRASDGVIVYANHRFAEIMGYEHGELDGRPVTDITWEDEPGQAELVAKPDQPRYRALRRGTLRAAQPAQGRKPDLV